MRFSTFVYLTIYVATLKIKIKNKKEEDNFHMHLVEYGSYIHKRGARGGAKIAEHCEVPFAPLAFGPNVC